MKKFHLKFEVATPIICATLENCGFRLITFLLFNLTSTMMTSEAVATRAVACYVLWQRVPLQRALAFNLQSVHKYRVKPVSAKQTWNVTALTLFSFSSPCRMVSSNTYNIFWIRHPPKFSTPTSRLFFYLSNSWWRTTCTAQLHSHCAGCQRNK